MPIETQVRVRGRKRNYRKRGTRKGTKKVNYKGWSVSNYRKRSGKSGPFAKNMYTALRFALEPISVDSAAGIYQYQFRANSLFDPDLTGTGGQPRYFDTLLGADGGTAIYRNYRVHGAKLQVTVWPTVTTAGNSNMLLCITFHRSTVSAPATMLEAQERSDTKTRRISSANNSMPVTFSLFNKIKQILGHKDLVDVDATASAYNANPNEVVYITFSAFGIDTASNVQFSWQPVLKQYSQMYTLNDVADS